jgi:hypothetical protein
MARLLLLTHVKSGLRDWLWPLFAQWFVFLTAIIGKLLGGLEAHPAVQFPKQCLEERCGLAVSLPCVRLVVPWLEIKDPAALGAVGGFSAAPFQKETACRSSSARCTRQSPKSGCRR